jgi:hypothetical protein
VYKTLPSSPSDRNVALRDPFPDGLVDKVIGTDSRGNDVSLSDLHHDDLDELLGHIERSQPLDESDDIPAARYMMSPGLAEFLAYHARALD